METPSAAPVITAPARGALSRYVAECRQESARSIAGGGGPHGRLRVSPLCVVDPLVVRAESRRGRAVAVTDDGALLGPARLSRLLVSGDERRPLLFADRAALRAACRAAEPSSRHFATALSILARTPRCATAGVLAEALAETWWTPEGADPAEVATWHRAFRTGGDLSVLVKRAAGLVGDAGSGRAFESPDGTPQVRSAFVQPATASRFLVGGRSAIHAAWRVVSKAHESWRNRCLVDPLLRGYQVLAGEVVEMVPEVLIGGVDGPVSSPCKLRAPSDVQVISGSSDGEAHLAKLHYRDGLRAELHFGRSRSQQRGLELAHSAFSTGETLYLAPVLFSGWRSRSSGRWLFHTDDGRTPPQVPLDVVLAAQG